MPLRCSGHPIRANPLRRIRSSSPPMTGMIRFARPQNKHPMNMNTRREFLSITLKGATMAAASGLLAEAAAAPDVANMAGNAGSAQTSGGNANGHYKSPFKLAMGGVRLGNE